MTLKKGAKGKIWELNHTLKRIPFQKGCKNNSDSHRPFRCIFYECHNENTPI